MEINKKIHSGGNLRVKFEPNLTPTLIFLKEHFYKNKNLNFGRKIKNKLRTKPDLLS